MLFCLWQENSFPSSVQLAVKLTVMLFFGLCVCEGAESCVPGGFVGRSCRSEGHELKVEHVIVISSLSFTAGGVSKVIGHGLSENMKMRQCQKCNGEHTLQPVTILL